VVDLFQKEMNGVGDRLERGKFDDETESFVFDISVPTWNRKCNLDLVRTGTKPVVCSFVLRF
jgi:hypothetical protein